MMSNNPESSMESIEPAIEPTTEANLVKSVPVNRGDDIWKLLSQVINLNNEKIIHEPTCPICSSPYRKEIEQKYLSTSSLTEAKNVLKDKANLDLDEVVFENHMTMHMTQGVKELQKVEYAQRIRRLYSQNLTTLDRISMSFAVIMERLLGVNSLIPSTEETVAEIEKIKSAETARLTGVLHNLLKLQASILGEMKTSGELLTIPQKEFIDTFLEALQNAKTDKERNLIRNLLDKLENLAKKTQI